MMKRIKEYLEYRKNRKSAKKELARIAATALPTIRQVAERNAETVRFVHRLVDSAKGIEGEQLMALVLDAIANSLNTSNGKLIETISYMANLSSEDIQKILVHSVVETLDTESGQ